MPSLSLKFPSSALPKNSEDAAINCRCTGVGVVLSPTKTCTISVPSLFSWLDLSYTRWSIDVLERAAGIFPWVLRFAQHGGRRIPARRLDFGLHGAG